jgi:hypothetical protein
MFFRDYNYALAALRAVYACGVPRLPHDTIHAFRLSCKQARRSGYDPAAWGQAFARAWIDMHTAISNGVSK